MDLPLIINQLLAEFATKYGLPSLVLNQEGVAALCFDDHLQLALILVSERDQLVLQANVAELHQVGEGIFRQLASFNRHWYQFNLHFGFDESSLMVQLYRQMSASQLTLASLETSLASMLEHAEFWQELLRSSHHVETSHDEMQGVRV
ncbi:type III secretion system chaperone [Aeromonas dhakensis]|uniref:type III secretion system chaperone n=1 Tax=Aeromonas dhakensis TaxID=196024 RepID=UPI00047810D8|nr:type III secretion system chaperone [Aeromonas dhakensis]MBL0675782.1 CesT family type III secretion system chaperone [Aeromonas dhakensis]MDX7743630.1 type III secretion system chaperone [Aeromonas dhakensis]WAF99351.1 type III secretion system chaperone [Aeromonas dhakensis]HDZ8834166.1 CesT family type III secretion system chaperone [Aeromonas dhakensis]HDZ8927560.1 CesT family type III secretion system chaperone [Aeromonas dhakensis]